MLIHSRGVFISAGFAGLLWLAVFQWQVNAEEFSIQVGDTVAPNVPGTGAGRLDVGAYTDVYTFQAQSNQIVFFEEMEIAPALRGWLRWELITPSGGKTFSQLFSLQGTGRKTLPESGSYTIRFFIIQEDPAHLGDYSFRLRAVPPDQIITVELGSTVSSNVPAIGAGNLEMPGAEDRYEFMVSAGQNVFFEELGSSPTFNGSLRWACTTPSRQVLFTSLFRPQGIGRKTLAEAGKYNLRFFVSDANPSHIGDYSFRLSAIDPDPIFPIQLGATITNGVPAAGAGNLEVPGAEDRYTFSGTSGQSVFFEELAVDQVLNLALRWECRSPSGGLVFSGIFLPQTGRKTLPETGTYTIRCYVSDNDPLHMGTYSFRTRTIEAETNFPIHIGDIVAAGTSAPGTGQLELPGSQDIYSFEGAQSQRVIFEVLDLADELVGGLRWELKAPSGTPVFSQLFQGPPLSHVYILPENGTYSLRLYVSDTDPRFIGSYSFRTFSPLAAFSDSVITAPNTPLPIPFSSLLCNDQHEAMDTVDIELPSTMSQQGGTLTRNATSVIYAPPTGFVGVDVFEYRLRGNFGGVSTNCVTVGVLAEATNTAAVVSVNLSGRGAADLCLLGLPRQTYAVEESNDLLSWSSNGTLTSDDSGRISWTLTAGNEPAKFYRFREP
jgi:hypothetical protein